MADVQQHETLCKGCLRWTWMLRTLCHCHAALNRMETGSSISVPPSDYERIMQLHSMLYITSYVHALLLYTPFVPKLNNLISPTSSDPSHLPTWHLIKYVTYLGHWKWIWMNDLSCTVTEMEISAGMIRILFTDIKQQLLQCLSVHRVIFNGWWFW